jgi:PIN domain nuclease of toxin-antitoxin system
MAKRSSTTSVANEYVTDAHALIWFLEGNPRLGPNARAALQDPASVLYLPIIALAEACWVVEHGRCAIPAVADLLADVDADPRIVLVPLHRALLDRSLTLTPLNEMHDRLIVATARYLAGTGAPVPLLTCDGIITSSGLVPVVW